MNGIYKTYYDLKREMSEFKREKNKEIYINNSRSQNTSRPIDSSVMNTSRPTDSSVVNTSHPADSSVIDTSLPTDSSVKSSTCSDRSNCNQIDRDLIPAPETKVRNLTKMCKTNAGRKLVQAQIEYSMGNSRIPKNVMKRLKEFQSEFDEFCKKDARLNLYLTILARAGWRINSALNATSRTINITDHSRAGNLPYARGLLGPITGKAKYYQEKLQSFC